MLFKLTPCNETVVTLCVKLELRECLSYYQLLSGCHLFCLIRQLPMAGSVVVNANYAAWCPMVGVTSNLVAVSGYVPPSHKHGHKGFADVSISRRRTSYKPSNGLFGRNMSVLTMKPCIERVPTLAFGRNKSVGVYGPSETLIKLGASRHCKTMGGTMPESDGSTS